jgi:hypothetical protein
MDNRMTPPYWMPAPERVPQVYGMFPHHHYHYPPMPMAQGCCGGAFIHSIPNPPAPLAPFGGWGMPYGRIPVHQPTIPMMPPEPSSYQTKPSNRPAPVWESPESPESPWIRAYRKHEQDLPGKG